jgi:hypothetical protein
MEVVQSNEKDSDFKKALALEQIYEDQSQISTAETNLVMEKIKRTRDFIIDLEKEGWGGKGLAKKVDEVYEIAKKKGDPKTMLSILKFLSELTLLEKSKAEIPKFNLNIQNNNAPVSKEDLISYQAEEELRQRRKKTMSG